MTANKFLLQQILGSKIFWVQKRILIEEFWVLVQFWAKKNVVRIDLSRTKVNRINVIRMNVTRINSSWKMFSDLFFPDLTSPNLTLSNSTNNILIEIIKTSNNIFRPSTHTMDIPHTSHWNPPDTNQSMAMYAEVRNFVNVFKISQN